MSYCGRTVVKPTNMGHLEFLQEKINNLNNRNQDALLLLYRMQWNRKQIRCDFSCLYFWRTYVSFKLKYLYILNVSECRLYKCKISNSLRILQKTNNFELQLDGPILSIVFAMWEDTRFGRSWTRGNQTIKCTSFFQLFSTIVKISNSQPWHMEKQVWKSFPVPLFSSLAWTTF